MKEQFRYFKGIFAIALIAAIGCWVGIYHGRHDLKKEASFVRQDTSKVVFEHEYGNIVALQQIGGKYIIQECSNSKSHLLVTSDTVIFVINSNGLVPNVSGKPIGLSDDKTTLVSITKLGRRFGLTRASTHHRIALQKQENFVVLKIEGIDPIFVFTEISSCEKAKEILQKELNSH